MEPLLAVVLAARRPPTRRQLHAAALTLDPAMTANEFRRRLDALRKLLVPLPAGPDAAVAAAAAASFPLKDTTTRNVTSAAEGKIQRHVSARQTVHSVKLLLFTFLFSSFRCAS